MITGGLKSKVDNIWNTMWSGGISNPLSVIEQLTYLLFIKRLDELHTLKEAKAARTGKPIEDPIFTAKRYRYRLHVSGMPGRPDLVFSGRRKVIFIHGCFWHRHARCKLARLPKSRLEFWIPKLDANRGVGA